VTKNKKERMMSISKRIIKQNENIVPGIVSVPAFATV
jgi:hypothetical protein